MREWCFQPMHIGTHIIWTLAFTHCAPRPTGSLTEKSQPGACPWVCQARPWPCKICFQDLCNLPCCFSNPPHACARHPVIQSARGPPTPVTPPRARAAAVSLPRATCQEGFLARTDNLVRFPARGRAPCGYGVMSRRGGSCCACCHHTRPTERYTCGHLTH